jgi:hypothetical protein
MVAAPGRVASASVGVSASATGHASKLLALRLRLGGYNGLDLGINDDTGIDDRRPERAGCMSEAGACTPSLSPATRPTGRKLQCIATDPWLGQHRNDKYPVVIITWVHYYLGGIS